MAISCRHSEIAGADASSFRSRNSRIQFVAGSDAAMSAPQVEKLESDVTREEAEGLITFVQTVSTSFRGYSEEDVSLLAGHFSVMRFEPGQVVMQKGEQGTWFGVLLSGTIEVEISPTLTV